MAVRDEISALAKRHFEQKLPTAFVPGETYVPVSGKVIEADDLELLLDASMDMWLTAGRYAERFEKEFAKKLGFKKSLLTNSGSSANLLAFSALTSPKQGDRRLVAGDEVITVAAGFPTTVAPIVQNGCVPVFVDVDHRTHNIDVSLLEGALSSRTRAIMVAHALGNPFDAPRVAEFAKKHKLILIEDMCDAVGARIADRPVGSFGELATVSFYPAHHMTMGEGGAILGNSAALMTIVESFRDWGRDCWCAPGKDNTCGKRFDWELGELPCGYDHKYTYTHVGYNLKVTDMQAAVGCAQLAKLDRFVEARRRNHAALAQGFKDDEQLSEHFQIVEATPGSEPSWFGFVLSVREGSPLARNDVTRYLEDHRVGTRLVFAGNLVRQPAFKDVRYRVASPLTSTDAVMNRSFWVGVWPGLGPAHLEYMLSTFKSAVADLVK
ncbi:MAG TPA: lipopolysaccharide biosynthesis protein RfbH [Polyangiaceae bacterium]